MFSARKSWFAFIAAVLIPPSLAEAQAPAPLLIPFNTGFSHSDNHWIAWMPTHPVYEAIEVRSTGTEVRVFLTERAGSKKQIYYFNTEAAAKAFQGEGYYRAINYTAQGEPGGPVNLDVQFHDKNDRAIELSLHFAPGQRLSDQHAGLTNQMGHNAEVLFLIFFREKAASAAQIHLVMDGQDYSITSESATSAEQLTRTGYRSNAFVATFLYGQSQYVWRDGKLTNSWRRVFERVTGPEDGAVYRAKVPDGPTIEIVTNSGGEMREYRHLIGDHVFRVRFSPVLPSLQSAQTGQRVHYQASIDEFGVLVQGTAVVRKSGNQISIDWQHDSPAWARNYHFQSTIQPTANGYDLEVRKTPAPPGGS